MKSRKTTIVLIYQLLKRYTFSVNIFLVTVNHDAPFCTDKDFFYLYCEGSLPSSRFPI